MTSWDAMTPSLIGDLAVALLLVVTIAYAGILNRRLGALRGDKARLEAMIEGLKAATADAQASIAGLRQAAGDVGADLERQVAAGNSLRDDLTYLVERGGDLADRLEGTIRAKRGDAPPRPAEAPRPAPARAPTVDKVTPLRAEPGDLPAPRRSGAISRTERDLLRALGGRR